MARSASMALAVETHYIAVGFLICSLTRLVELFVPDLDYGICCQDSLQIIYLAAKSVIGTTLLTMYYIMFNVMKLEQKAGHVLALVLVSVIIFCPAILIQVGMIASWSKDVGSVEAIIAFLIQAACIFGLFAIVRLAMFLFVGAAHLPTEEDMRKPSQSLNSYASSEVSCDVQFTAPVPQAPQAPQEKPRKGKVLLRPFKSDSSQNDFPSSPSACDQLNPMVKYMTDGPISKKKSHGKPLDLRGVEPPPGRLSGPKSSASPRSARSTKSTISVTSLQSKGELSPISSRSPRSPKLRSSNSKQSTASSKGSRYSAGSATSTRSTEQIKIPFHIAELAEFDRLVEDGFAVTGLVHQNEDAPPLLPGEEVVLNLETFYWEAPHCVAVMLAHETAKHVVLDLEKSTDKLLTRKFFVALLRLKRGSSCTIVVGPKYKPEDIIWNGKPDPEKCYMIYNVEVE